MYSYSLKKNIPLGFKSFQYTIYKETYGIQTILTKMIVIVLTPNISSLIVWNNKPPISFQFPYIFFERDCVFNFGNNMIFSF